MARSRHQLTPALQEQIVAFIRAGGYPHVAAEAAGLPREVFARWRARGRRSDAPPAYREFERAICEAEAQARLQAELTIRGDKPLDWLKAGPGKDRADNPGWTNPGKPRAAAADGGADLELLWPRILHLLGRCAEKLQDYPEARAALVAWLAGLPDPAKMAPDDMN
jgi:hypothetical protein